MLTTTTSLMLGCSFILTAALCVWLILEGTSGATKRDRSERLIAAHRIAGYTFIALFCLMLYYMFGRLGSGRDGR